LSPSRFLSRRKFTAASRARNAAEIEELKQALPLGIPAGTRYPEKLLKALTI